MKLLRVNDTVSFVVGDTYLYGVIKERVETEDGIVYRIVTTRKVYVNVSENRILRNFGEMNGE